MPNEDGACVKCPKCNGRTYPAHPCICWLEWDLTGQSGGAPIGYLMLPLWPGLLASSWVSGLLPEGFVQPKEPPHHLSLIGGAA